MEKKHGKCIVNVEPPGKQPVSIYFSILTACLCESYTQSLQKILVVFVSSRKGMNTSSY